MSDSPIIVWFTHDLRLSDHAALSAVAASGHPLLPVYILDDDTPGDWAMGGASRWWLEQSLASLQAGLKDRSGRLILRRGNPLRLHSFEDLIAQPDARMGVVTGTIQIDNARSLGIDPDRFSYPYQGLNQRLIGPANGPKLIHDLLA